MERDNMKRNIIIGSVAIAILIIALIAYLINTNNLENDGVKMQEIADVNTLEGNDSVEYDNTNTESTSTEMGKTVEESENELNQEESNSNSSDTKTNNKKTQTTASSISTDTKTADSKKEDKKDAEVKFVAPVKGEIIREFSSDSLVYSKTLDEWITHNGIDIKADKTSVVTAAANGTVYAIKNDPRYGLTVIINHDGGYQTVYSNLLTAEFVVEGEKVEAGQTIGTVGNSASFESSDDYHLHFEILKDNKYVDPTTCINF